MAEFFLELFRKKFCKLTKKCKRKYFRSFKKLFDEKNLSFKKSLSYSVQQINNLISRFTKGSYSTKGRDKRSKYKFTNEALNGFLKSNNIKKDQLFKKTDKGEFYFLISQKKS